MAALNTLRTPTNAQRPAPWQWAVLVSLVVHAVLLMALQPGPGPSVVAAPRSAARFMMQLQPSVPGPWPMANPHHPILTDVASRAPLQTAHDTQQQAQLPAPVQPPDPQTASNYLAVSELSAKPYFLRHKKPPSAMQLPDVMPTPVVARLRINAQGDVDRVALGENRLSAPAQVLIQESFLNMQFSPGMLGTVAVKSELVVEIQLEPTLPTLDL